MLTTGGTGVAARDVTPEATRSYSTAGAGNRGGDPRRRGREDAPRVAVARRRRHPRQDARRQPARLAGGLPRRVRRASAGARARPAPARRRGDARTGRRDGRRHRLPAALRVAREARAHGVRAAVRVRRRVPRRSTRCRARRAPLAHARDGRRSLACDGGQPPVDADLDARNPRTAARELPRGTLAPWQVVVVLRRLARRLPARGLPPRSGRSLAVADPGRDVRRLPVSQARHVAQPRCGSARRSVSRPSAAGWR